MLVISIVDRLMARLKLNSLRCAHITDGLEGEGEGRNGIHLNIKGDFYAAGEYGFAMALPRLRTGGWPIVPLGGSSGIPLPKLLGDPDWFWRADPLGLETCALVCAPTLYILTRKDLMTRILSLRSFIIAGLVSLPAVSAMATLTLTGTVRDFPAVPKFMDPTYNPDFENIKTDSQGVVTGIVQSTLGADGKPVYAHGTSDYTAGKPAGPYGIGYQGVTIGDESHNARYYFNQWFGSEGYYSMPSTPANPVIARPTFQASITLNDIGGGLLIVAEVMAW